MCLPFSVTLLQVRALSHISGCHPYLLYILMPTSDLFLNHTASTVWYPQWWLCLLNKYCSNCVWCFEPTGLLTCVTVPENPISMFCKWLEFFTRVITRFSMYSNDLSCLPCENMPGLVGNGLWKTFKEPGPMLWWEIVPAPCYGQSLV